MATLAAFTHPFMAWPLFRSLAAVKHTPVTQNPSAALRLESATFTHALVALAAKLAAVDGAPNKAEYQAFQALFVDRDGGDSSKLRSLFVKHLDDRSTAVQFARQIAGMTAGDTRLHTDLLQRLLQIATADAALNAAEMELLRVISQVLGMSREDFRVVLDQHIVSASASPYAVLGVAPNVSDDVLRARYMAQVQFLHPDRYHAAGASADTVALLSDQLARLNAAYEQIRRERATKWGRKTAKGAKADSA